MERLYDKLSSYNDEDYYPMHMPGHKRNVELMQMMNPYSVDITEVEGFDNLHQAKGILKQLAKRLSQLYGAERSFPLVNGSTVGILAGISAATAFGDKVIIARNCHKAVYHAVVIKHLIPVYYYPPQIEEIPIYGGISASDIEEMLIKNKDISLVVITSPTYEGVVSDIGAVAEVVHRYGALLLVDEAHGAHFGFHESFPKSAVVLGADIVIQSLHKTLPAFTQTAVLHSNRSILDSRIEQYLDIYESSSPSYLLMAGIDRCVSLLEDRGKALFDAYTDRLNKFYHSMKKLKCLKLLEQDIIGKYEVANIDLSKITISVGRTPISGQQLQTMLREKYHIIMEMETPCYVLAMTSICDTEEGFDRLAEALQEIDRELEAAPQQTGVKVARSIESIQEMRSQESMRPYESMLPWQAKEYRSEQITLDSSCGRVAAAFVCMYPPGSPLLVPGERIDQQLISHIKWLQQEGITITGLGEENQSEIEVICNDQ